MIERLYNAFLNSSGVSIDTRTLISGEMFFALSGENFDGNVFAQTAINGGASCVVVSDPRIVGDGVIHVENCLKALQELAAHHRDKFDIPIIAITGSNGKTTTKELVSQVLSTNFQTVATKGNLNNHIGVPLTLLTISEKTEVAVIEMGANHIGEIGFLCALTKPTHGLITNIGKAHLEGFGSLEGVKKAKSELYDFLRSSDGVVFVNLSSDDLEELSKGVNQKVTYAVYDRNSSNSADYRFSLEKSDSELSLALRTTDNEVLRFDSRLYGAYNASNIATAITLGYYFGVETEDISTAINSYRAENNRSQVVKKGSRTILLDAYNANPVSMKLAVSDLVEWNGSNCLILGGMNELGEFADAEHMNLLKFISKYDWSEVILIGEHFKEMYREFEYTWFENVSACQRYLEEHQISGEVVLIKGSRSLQLESLLDYIK